MPIKNWSTTAANNNSSPPNGAPEGMLPGAVNDTIRQNMADVRAYCEDAQWFDWGHVPTRVNDTQFTVPTDQTAVYSVDRRVRVVGSTTGYGTITASSYSAPDTTITVSWDSGTTPASPTAVSVGILGPTNRAFPATVARTDGNNTFLGNQTVSGTVPWVNVKKSDAAADEKIWLAVVVGKQYSLRAYDDALSVNAPFLQADRTGTTIDTVTLTGTTINLAGTGQVSGNTIWHAGNFGAPVVKVSTSATTSASTTPVSINGMTGWTLEAGSQYEIEGMLELSDGGTSAVWQLLYNYSGSFLTESTIRKTWMYVSGYSTLSATPFTVSRMFSDMTFGAGIRLSNSGVLFRGMIRTDTGGTLNFQFARSSGSTTLSVGTRSYLSVRKIA